MSGAACARPYEAALQGLEGIVGAEALGRGLERVEAARGGELLFTLATPDRLRWFRAIEGRVAEIRPTDDERVPLGRHLAALADEGLEVTVLSWRPGRRIVLRVDGNPEPRVMKGYRKNRSAKAAYNHREAAQASGHHSFVVPRLLRHDPALECLHFEYLEGGPLRLDATSDGTDPEVERFFRIGVSLAEFQTSGSIGELELHGPEAEGLVLDRMHERTVRAGPGVPPEWGPVRRRLAAIAHRISCPSWGRAHRDLHDGQFHDLGDRMALMDFDLMCLADPVLDIANLTAHLQLRALQELSGATAATVLTAGTALLEGLDRMHEPGFLRRLRFYQASTYLRLALVYLVRPGWSHLVPTLLHCAERCLDEIEHERNE